MSTPNTPSSQPAALVQNHRPMPIDFTIDEQRVAEIKKQLQAAGVEYCFAPYVDIHGSPKAKATPIDVFEKLCKGAELYTVGAVEGLGLAGPHEDECATVPDLDTVTILPWDTSKAWINADLYYHGKPYPCDPRRILRNAIDRAAAMGYRMNLGIEPEFYILKRDADGQLKPITKTSYHGPNACYDLTLTNESFDLLKPITQYLKTLGWGLYSFDQECGRGQHEFDFGYTDALAMADRLVLFRTMVKHVASTFDAIATFLPKPFANDFRSGAHFNMSLADINTGDNLFAFDASADNKLANQHGLPMTDLGYRFIAGILRNAEAITAVACPTYNSYQGLVAQGDLADFSWAPVLVTYGHNNRSSMLRVPINRPCIENRAVDMAVNPYLAAAMMLHAGLDGIEQQLDPGDPFNSDLYKLTGAQRRARGVHNLPPTLLHALQAFEESELAERALGTTFKEIYHGHKMREWESSFYSVSNEQREALLTRL